MNRWKNEWMNERPDTGQSVWQEDVLAVCPPTIQSETEQKFITLSRKNT